MSYKQALLSPARSSWQKAIDEEMASIRANDTFSLVPLPPGRKAVGCKWVFKLKRDSAGNIVRYKARLVAQGFSQQHGIDYNETFSPVVRHETIRTLLALAAVQDLEVHQLDVKTAFLNGDLSEEIYMRQPPGFVDSQHPNFALGLHKTLYGLKQAAREWNRKLHSVMVALGFTRSSSDPCFYHRGHGPDLVFVLVYVDDCILASASLDAVIETKALLSNSFTTTDLGPIDYILGIQVQRDRANNVITISQRQYIVDTLSRFGLSDCKPSPTPSSGAHLSSTDSPFTPSQVSEMSNVPFRSLVGCLLYIATCTRPDISAAVGAVSAFLSNPGRAHWTAAKRILRYLAGTIDFKLTYSSSSSSSFSPTSLRGFSDANWGGDIDTRRSTSGYVFMLSGGAVSWGSKRQHCVALSSMESEYIALSLATREATWLRRLLSDFTAHDSASPVTLFQDNQSCIAFASEHRFHKRSKHIDIRHHHVRDSIDSGIIALEYLPTDAMTADILTKPLSRTKHHVHVLGLGLHA